MKDIAPDGPHAWIQHKGSNLCMDVWCICGEHFHVDAGFCYYTKCPVCLRVYETGSHIKLIELTTDEIKAIDNVNVIVTDTDREEELKFAKWFNEI